MHWKVAGQEVGLRQFAVNDAARNQVDNFSMENEATSLRQPGADIAAGAGVFAVLSATAPLTVTEDQIEIIAAGNVL